MRKLLTGIVLLLRCLTLPAQSVEDSVIPCVPDSTQIENSIVDAVLLLESGDILGATHLLDSLSKACPENDAVLYYQGLCLYSVGDYPGAASVIAKAVETDPSNSWYKETLAGLYLNIGKTEEAMALYEDLKLAKPAKYPDLFTNSLAADAYRLKRDYPSFFKALTALVQDENADDEMKYKSLMSSLGGFDSRTFNALLPQLDTLMQRYCEAEPRSIHAHSLRMEIAINRDDNATIIDECYRLIELYPDDPDQQVSYLGIIGDTLHASGQESKAFKIYEQALSGRSRKGIDRFDLSVRILFGKPFSNLFRIFTGHAQPAGQSQVKNILSCLKNLGECAFESFFIDTGGFCNASCTHGLIEFIDRFIVIFLFPACICKQERQGEHFYVPFSQLVRMNITSGISKQHIIVSHIFPPATH